MRSAMTRRSVLLPQPDGPMSDTNSPRWMDRSMPWSAVVTTSSPRLKTLSTPARVTTGPPVAGELEAAVMQALPLSGLRRRRGPAAKDEVLDGSKDEEERDP